MQTIGGVFDSRGQAVLAVRALGAAAVRDENIVVLMPGGDPTEFHLQSEMMHDSAGPGAWGALGAGLGSFAGAAVITAILPGIGPILGLGALAAAFVAGGIGGKFAGDAIERTSVHDDVGDDFFLFADSLRRNKAVVIVMLVAKTDPKAVEQILRASGAMTFDEARTRFWRAWRDREERYYESLGQDRSFALVEAAYRRGFETGFDPRFRGRKFEAVAVKLRPKFRDDEEEDFRCGFERAQELLWKQQQEAIETQRATERGPGLSDVGRPSAPSIP